MQIKLRKIISISLCALLIFTLSFSASAAAFSGEGTKKSPYLIETAADLNALSKAVAEGESFDGKYILLTKDITADASFSPIGSEEAPFAGSFDGNGKTLSGFELDCDYAAVFAYCDGAVISDLTVSGEFFAENYAGAVAAYAKDTVIRDCKSAASAYADNYVGGIVGYIDSGRITDCTATSGGVVGGYEENCGGIAGYSNAVISDCVNNAYVYGVKNVGGIAGTSKNSITSCTNTVAVTADTSNLGGIAGLCEGEIRYCKNTGRISGNSNTGGIAGTLYNAEISECLVTGAVSATGSFAAGIAGYTTDGSITNCIATGNVSTSSSYAGGIFGYSLRTAVSKCIYTASVSAKSSTDAAIGAVAGSNVSDCYYNSSNESKAVLTGTAANTKGVSESSLTDKTALSVLDFDKVWAINELHASYPLLMSIPYHTLDVSTETEASCTKDGILSGVCTVCSETVNTVTPAYGHSFKVISSKAPSCTVAGYEDSVCTICDETKSVNLAATGHTDSNADSTCDMCSADMSSDKNVNEEKSFFEKIADFFEKLLEWIRNLFN